MLEREADGWSALYFDGSTHGSPLTLGGMICGWPKASYPSSAAEESSILEHVRDTVGEKRSSGNIVAAIVIEPTQQSTGYVASDSFMSGLRSIANDFEAALIIDETSTGCGASGKGFWQSTESADYVAFGKRTQAVGFYSKTAGVSLGGSENSVKLFSTISKGITQDQLLAQVSQVGEKISIGTEGASSLPGITDARTSGTSLWVHTDSAATTVKLVAHMRSLGVLVKQNGSNCVVAKPALVLGQP